ncbi:hypothetical protein [Mesonia sp. HuA40]|uniref:hypothetical protein n=1 Tax=Mesonia sp. HuA40 TaxID=2602761 RepID=UPI0011C81A8F|nr:hypothetical protein [Mesonia sp. HuA40]TXK71867.1 hypothetical protein FT993_08525 [Mesonia sp. HuA40]
MNIFKWFQKKGSVGSIVRTIIKQYKLLKNQNSELDDDEILEMIFENRYRTMKAKPGEKKRYLFAMADSNTYKSIKSLSMAIINIEMDVSYSDGKVYENCLNIVDEEIERLL